MSVITNELAAIKFAIEIETRGWEFYKAASALTNDPDHKDLLLLLLTEEYRHRNTFEDLYQEFSADPNSTEDFSEETQSYLNTLLETHVFPAADEVPFVLQQLQTLDAILQTALQAEKNLVLFYDELMLQSQLPAVREAFSALKREEQNHVVQIQEMIRGYA